MDDKQARREKITAALLDKAKGENTPEDALILGAMLGEVFSMLDNIERAVIALERIADSTGLAVYKMH